MLHPIDVMLHPGCEVERGTPGTYLTHREARHKLQQSQRRQKRDCDLRLEEIKLSLCDAVYRFNRSIVLGQKIQPIWSGPWIVKKSVREAASVAALPLKHVTAEVTLKRNSVSLESRGSKKRKSREHESSAGTFIYTPVRRHTVRYHLLWFVKPDTAC